eukprot:CAMPEP_0194522424 /NCGR_PEP_ID=MMETSP0253-20130528/56990_1 /TAXON_ID=2966 /ORGANISM="Noctiluca scintillans" /LENGTH=326 /DNA_ID=CAMNT_0039366859 /DNA_START=47 /DNA_END=1027 /DNA_ORIENTATION=+
MALCSGFATIVTCVITFSHLRTLRDAPLTMQRRYYRATVLLPVVWAVSGVSSLVNPRGVDLMEILQELYTAWVVGSFGVLLFLVLSHRSGVEGRVDEDTWAVQTTTGPAQRIVAALAAQGPRHHFWLPPLCCLRWCIKPHDLAVQHLLFLFMCIKQFFWVTVVYAIATLHLEIAEPRFPYAKVILQVLMKTSTVFVIWALLVLVRSSSVMVGDMNFFLKFVTIKCTIVWEVIHGPVFCAILRAVGWKSSCATVETESRMLWMSFVCLWSVVLALMIRKAFSTSEIMVITAGQDLSPELQEMDLRLALNGAPSPREVRSVAGVDPVF